MKKLLLLLFLFNLTTSQGQTYSSHNIDLLAKIAPDTVQPQTGNRYSGCWGWYQASKNKEYAISGGRNGTWFIDVTNPTTPTVCAFVPGKSKNCTWRELKTYQNYCYIVSDVCSPNVFQIVDMQYLPDSVRVVHSDTTLFTLGHTNFIDKDKMYVASTNFGSKGYTPLTVWSLANPTAPKLYRNIVRDDSTVADVHDMYVRNDTVYASVGWQGLRMYKLNGDSSLTQLGSYSNYHSGSYNHSSWLTQNGKYLVFCDEVPANLPVKLVDVQNLSNIQPVRSWLPEPKTTPHNPYVIGNDFVVVSSYQDGLFIYNIKNPPEVNICGWFDTYHQGGHNTGTYSTNTYQGNWGAYPYLPSGIIIANDMQNGVFILDPTDAYNKQHFASLSENKSRDLRVYPTPASDALYISVKKDGNYKLSLVNTLGEVVLTDTFSGNRFELSTRRLAAGSYILMLDGVEGKLVKKVVITR